MKNTHTNAYNRLKNFLETKMRMSHIYQPLFIQELLKSNGSITLEEIANAFLRYDKSQQEYYAHIVKTMPSKILKRHGIIKQKGRRKYSFTKEFNDITSEEATELIKLCTEKIENFLQKRKDTYNHRMRNFNNLSGSLRYKIIKRANARCEACGISAEERAIDVDHIIPKNKGGSDDESNLQALCYKCNRQKRDTDATDFKKQKESYELRDNQCIFCNLKDNCIEIIAENELAIAFYDNYAVTKYHTLIIPKRHIANYFELYQPELNAINQLIQQQRKYLENKDNTITGFNIGVNIGEDAGQSIFHVHIHLIPRRHADMKNPKGGVRGVIPNKQKY